jgi:hypothetical protein
MTMHMMHKKHSLILQDDPKILNRKNNNNNKKERRKKDGAQNMLSSLTYQKKNVINSCII